MPSPGFEPERPFKAEQLSGWSKHGAASSGSPRAPQGFQIAPDFASELRRTLAEILKKLDKVGSAHYQAPHEYPCQCRTCAGWGNAAKSAPCTLRCSGCEDAGNLDEQLAEEFMEDSGMNGDTRHTVRTEFEEAPHSQPEALPEALPECAGKASIGGRASRMLAEAEEKEVNKLQSIGQQHTDSQILITAELAKYFGANNPGPCRLALRHVTSSVAFDGIICALVCLNSILIGWQVQAIADHYTDASHQKLEIASNVFAGVFIVEILMRIPADGPAEFFLGANMYWNWFDAIVVLATVVETTITIWSLTAHGEVAESSALSNLRVLRVVKVARVLRVLRIARILNFVMALRTLVYSIFVTLKMLVWAAVLMCLIIYVFAVVFTEASVLNLLEADFLGVQGPQGDWRNYWGTLNQSCVTLFESLCGGLSWREATLHLRRIHPGYELAFVLYICVTYFCVVNVITGVFCSSAIAATEGDPELINYTDQLKKKKQQKLYRKLFNAIDGDDSGMVTIDELETSLHEGKVNAMLKALGIESSDAWLLFRSLDANKDGLVSLEDLGQGIHKLTSNSIFVEFARVTMHQRWMMKRLELLTPLAQNAA